MKKNLVALAVAAAFVVPGVAFAADTSNADTGPVVFGYAQITGAQQFGTGYNAASNSSSNGLIFGANRIRLGFKGEAVPGVTYFIQGAWDNAGIIGDGLNNGLGSNIATKGGQAQLIDAWVNYAPVPFAQLQVGKFKTPEGLEYTSVAGNDLTFIFRNMGQSLLPGRSAGAMLHADNVMGTGVGYAVGIFDNTSLDSYTAFSNGNAFGGGQGGLLNGNGKYITSGMLSYSMGPLLTAEVSGSMGTAQQYGGTDSLTSWNVGVQGGMMGIKYGAGYTRTNGTNMIGYMNAVPNSVGTVNASDWHAELAANLYEMTLTPDWLDVEPAVRYDQYHVTGAGTLGNATVGLNYFVNPNNPHAAEVQVNYILATRGGSINNAYGTPNGIAPINGVAYNTLMLQFQAGF
ncbi:porin [Acidithiobacillus ferrooxidans]|jgi:hypothetical protein|uniref:porin n=1 Tax=Acidithiobacillus ferrooxidans TaxID=920 RepID=UPI0015DCBE19|nr:porin [Acidithiobacillus ferrooxidans]MCL4525309.1 OprO/OprP family phosphate-selective porin [Gammaproteobacteria bacterium]MBU2775882.1 hypothetical protein [Acidithiobacillus ferrooxidans]MCR1343925.1 OprO/OprP family phosphate-selective porin [Acidithiobacillus ferrooxidans]MCR1349400.1 OprO/OprP family phosphate-selective porin [Acidithiobacillus ferrooxidans]QLK43751.1 hypothetical protein FE661_16455 [Acidithiobacillus ferrooxidans]